MKQFLKKGEVQLVNGGYLSNVDKRPVYNKAFVEAQQHAEYIITLAKLAKGKDFKGKKADSIDDLRLEVLRTLDASAPTIYVEGPKKVTMPTSDKLKKEALDFIKYNEEKGDTEKINLFMQQFNIMREFQNYGLFFEENIVKLNALYTWEEALAAVKSVITLI